MTGTKGKTTTSSLAHAILAADPLHPAILGGNIGTPLVERLPELTPDHRVVVELSELQLPALSRGTTVAVYTNVTSDHLDRHGSLEAYRRVKRRLAELVDPDGALVLNLEDPVVGGYAGLGTAPAVLLPGRPAACPAALGVLDGWIVSAAVERLPLAGGGSRRPARAAGSCRSTSWASPGATTSPTRWPRSPSGCCSASRRTRSAGPPRLHRRRAPAPVGRPRRRRPVRQRLAGHPARRGDRGAARLPAPVVLIAGGRDKGVDLAELARGRRGDRVRRGPDRRERAGARGPALRGAGLARTARAGPMDEAVAVADAFARLALAHQPPGRRGDRAAEPGRRIVRHVRGLRGPGPRLHRRRRRAWERRREHRRPHEHRAAPRRPPGGARRRPRHAQARAPRARVRDPRRDRRPRGHRHPDGLLVVRDQGLPARRRHVRDRRAPDPVGRPGARGDGRDDAGRLPLAARRVGAAVRDRHRGPPARVHPADQRRGRRLGALAQDRPAAGGPPGRVHEARAGRLPRALVRQAGERRPRAPGRARSRSS